MDEIQEIYNGHERILAHWGWRMEHRAVCIFCGKSYLVNDDSDMEKAARHTAECNFNKRTGFE